MKDGIKIILIGLPVAALAISIDQGWVLEDVWVNSKTLLAVFSIGLFAGVYGSIEAIIKKLKRGK